jgi:choline dehydrogenase-like flavoprotein
MLKSDIVVIGSGPGGSLTSALLAEAGRDVTILERGPHLQLSSCAPFSQTEMIQKYRNCGITVAFGKPKISYIEGCCVGGGSEINSGLYHRTPTDILTTWSKNFHVDELDNDSLLSYFKITESDLNVSLMPHGTLPLASLKLNEGALALGWDSKEVPRWFKYSTDGKGTKQSMTQTMIPRALSAGGKLNPGVRVDRLQRLGDYWHIQGVIDNEYLDGKKKTFAMQARNVFVCAGAIATPQLLQRSGIGRMAGKTLHMHPSIKLVARFPDQVNGLDMGVPVHQVKEFSPRFSFGCSISTPPYLSLAMIDVPNGQEIVRSHWPNMAIYYSMVTDGCGSVDNKVWAHDPFVKYDLGKAGFHNTLDGLERLGECLFEAGATVLYPSVQGASPIRNKSELRRFRYELSADRLNLMTIHLFSTCPMGENLNRCVTNSFGKVHGADGLYLNDASILCGALGVNPQGTIMAIARRNVDHFLSEN